MQGTLQLLLMPPDRWCQIEAYEIHCGKGLVVGLSLAVAFSTMQVTVCFGSVPSPIFRKNTGQGPSIHLTRGLAA
ncbi:hypothetical protein TNCV_2948031 [Trichonephila clavipes]|nr:hypothetical protein TNCV_2948031 [Trichonephila clavipes]